MPNLLTAPFARLFETSPEIERQPFITRPRTMAAAWGGMLLCKVAAMAVISPAAGVTGFAIVLVSGLAATYVRFGVPRSEATGNTVAQVGTS